MKDKRFNNVNMLKDNRRLLILIREMLEDDMEDLWDEPELFPQHPSMWHTNPDLKPN